MRSLSYKKPPLQLWEHQLSIALNLKGPCFPWTQSLGPFTPPSWHSLVLGRSLWRCRVHSTLSWCGLHCPAPSPLEGALWTPALAPSYWSLPAPLQGCSCVSICSSLPSPLPSFLPSWTHISQVDLELAMYLRKSLHFGFCLLSPGITGMYHHAYLICTVEQTQGFMNDRTSN